mgnify:CR=1 FL=1
MLLVVFPGLVNLIRIFYPDFFTVPPRHWILDTAKEIIKERQKSGVHIKNIVVFEN